MQARTAATALKVGPWRFEEFPRPAKGPPDQPSSVTVRRLRPVIRPMRSSARDSLDYLVRVRQQGLWDGETERVSGLEVDAEMEARRLLDR